MSKSHGKTNYKNGWLYFTVFEDEEAGEYYADIFDRAGKDVAQTESFATWREARTGAMDKIRELEAKAKEVRPTL